MTRAVMVTVGAAWLLAMLVSGCAGAMLPLRANVGGGVAMGRPPNRDFLRGATSPVVTGRFLFAPLQLVAPAGRRDSGGATPSQTPPRPAEQLAPGRAVLTAALSPCARGGPADVRIDAVIEGATGRIARFELSGAAASQVDRTCVGAVLARVRFMAPLPEPSVRWQMTVRVARRVAVDTESPAPGPGGRDRPSVFYRQFDFGLGYSFDAFRGGPPEAHHMVHGPTLGLSYYPHVWRRRRSVGRFGVHAYGDVLRHDGEWQGAGGGVGLAIDGATFASGSGGVGRRGCGFAAAAAHGEVGAGIEVNAGYRQLGDDRYVTLTVSLTLRTPAVGFIALVPPRRRQLRRGCFD